MKGGTKARGFTIVETLIVLAVTGGLFLAIAATLSGRQARTQFEQSINEIRSQIQQTINEVGAGFYQSVNNFTCTPTLTGPTFSAAGSTNQGENNGCTFLGKAIQFKVGSTDPEEFNVYTVVGLQRTSAGKEPISYAEAQPATVPDTIPDSFENKKLLYGLTTTNYPTSNYATIAFLNKLASNGSTIVSGAQQVNVVPITGSVRGDTAPQGIARINSSLPTSPVNPASGVDLCFVSGGSKQSGLITIGGNGRQLSVTLSIKNSQDCT